MAETIDKVQVEVEATAKGVSSTFAQLESQLKTLKSALEGIDVSKLSKVQNTIKNTTSNVASPKVDTSGITKAQAQIEASMSKIRDSIIRANSLAQAAFNGDSSSATSYERKAISIQGEIDVLRNKFQELSNVRINTDAFNKIDSEIEQTRTELQSLIDKQAQFVDSGGSQKSDEYTQMQTDIQNTSDKLSDLISKQQEMLDSGTAQYNPFASMESELDGLQGILSSTREQVANINSQSISPSVDTAGVTSLQSRLDGVWSTVSNLGSSFLTLSSRALNTGLDTVGTIANRVRSSIQGLNSAVTGLGRGFSSGFMKVLRYAFGIRSLYVLFRRLRQAVKDSFTQLQYSGAEFETTRANIESLKNSLLTLKYQFGAAFEPIFNTIAPALQTFINYLVAAMNTLSAFFAKLTGRSTYSKVASVTAKVASSAGSASKAVSDLNKQLQGFDELNNLDLDKGSSGGGGGGSGSGSESAMYEEASVESALGNFASNLADLIKAGDWQGVGSAISDKITDTLNGINWTSIKQKASNFGTNVANFFNGFINTDMFSSVGTTLAEALNTAFTSANSFALTFDWVNLGTSIGTGITQFFTDADFGMWGETVHNWVGGILDAGIALLQTTDFEEIGTKLGDFLEGVQVSDLLSKVKTLCSNIITAIGNTITGFKTNTDEKTKLTTAIGGLLGVLAITRNVPLTVTFAAVLGGIKIGDMVYESATGTTVNQSFIDEIEDIIDGLFGENKIEFDLLDFIQFTWSTLDTSTFAGKLYALLLSSITPAAILQSQGVDKLVWSWGDFITWDTDDWSAITTFFTNLGSFIGKQINSIWNGQTFSEAMVGANGMSSEAAQNTKYSSGLKEKAQELGKNIHDGIKKGFELAATVVAWSNPMYVLWQAINGAAEDQFEEHSPARKMYPLGKNIFLGIVEGFKEAMRNYGWLGLAGDLYDYCKNNMSYGKSSADWSTSIGDVITGSLGKASNMTIKIKTKLTGDAKSKKDIDNLKESFSNLNAEASKTSEATYKAGFGGKIAEITDLDTWKQKFTSLYEKWQSKSATMRSYVGGQMESIDDTYTWIDKITNLATKWTNSKSTTSMNVTSDVGNLDGSGGYLERLTKAANTWKNTKPTATFTTKLDGTLKSASEIDTVAKSFQTLGSNYDKVKGSHSSSWSISFGGASVESIKSYADAAYKLYQSFYEDDHTATWTMNVKGDTSGVDNFVQNIVDKLNSKLNNYRVRVQNVGNALGGIIDSNGNVKRIPQYADGTLNAGSVFVAGEHGPEVMGHINGRTEILNRSQMASIMSSSYIRAMSQFGNRMLATPESVAYSGTTYSSYNSAPNNSKDGVLLAEQNELLREQNNLLAQLLEKPTGITSRDIFNATRSEANNYYRRTGNGAFLS